MNIFSKLAAALAVLPILVFAPMAHASGGGQIEQGDIYRVEDITTNGSFADNISVACGDTVAFRVRIHNGGPDTLTNVKVSATLNGNSSTSHGSQVSLSADNNLNNMTVTANAGVNTSQATTATYVSGSTELLNYSTTPGGESVLQNLPDGILAGGINIGSIGPLTTDTEEVQFEAKLSCPAPTPTPTPTPVTPVAAAKTTALPNTGPGDVAEMFVGTSAFGGIGHYLFRRRRGL
jgi:uncharacterized repeat protein (TIGR01451 family)